jgi:hypothetical protein
MPPPSSHLTVYSLKEWYMCCNHELAIIVRDTCLYIKDRAYILTIEREVYALVFSELFTHILGIQTTSDNPVVFRLTYIVSLSKQRFEQVGMKTHDAKAIFDKVQKLCTVMKDMGNPFMEQTGDLFYTRYTNYFPS